MGLYNSLWEYASIDEDFRCHCAFFALVIMMLYYSHCSRSTYLIVSYLILCFWAAPGFLSGFTQVAYFGRWQAFVRRLNLKNAVAHGYRSSPDYRCGRRLIIIRELQEIPVWQAGQVIDDPAKIGTIMGKSTEQ